MAPLLLKQTVRTGISVRRIRLPFKAPGRSIAGIRDGEPAQRLFNAFPAVIRITQPLQLRQPLQLIDGRKIALGSIFKFDTHQTRHYYLQIILPVQLLVILSSQWVQNIEIIIVRTRQHQKMTRLCEGAAITACARNGYGILILKEVYRFA